MKSVKDMTIFELIKLFMNRELQEAHSDELDELENNAGSKI